MTGLLTPKSSEFFNLGTQNRPIFSILGCNILRCMLKATGLVHRVAPSFFIFGVPTKKRWRTSTVATPYTTPSITMITIMIILFIFARSKNVQLKSRPPLTASALEERNPKETKSNKGRSFLFHSCRQCNSVPKYNDRFDSGVKIERLLYFRPGWYLFLSRMPPRLSHSFYAVIHMQESPPHKRFLVGCSSPFIRLAEHLSFRFALGASNDCYLIGENPTCSVPAL